MGEVNSLCFDILHHFKSDFFFPAQLLFKYFNCVLSVPREIYFT